MLFRKIIFNNAATRVYNYFNKNVKFSYKKEHNNNIGYSYLLKVNY